MVRLQRLACRMIAGRALACAVLAGTVLSVASVPAEAQVRVAVGDQVGERGLFTTKGFEAYCRILGLDETQKAAARELMDGTAAANRTASDEMRVAMKAFSEKMQEAQKGGGLQSIQKILGEEMPKITGAYIEKRAELERQFFEDLKGMLTAQQAEKMPEVERFRRRETQLRSGMETFVDVLDVLDSLKISRESPSELADATRAYEMDVDRLLMERQRLAKESQDALQKTAGSFDFAAMEKAQEPLKENGKAIRELGKSSSMKIAGLLPEDQKVAFELEMKRRQFPRVYREPHVAKALEAALALSDLDEEQRRSLKALKEQYQREAAPLNRAWEKALEANAGGPMRVVMRQGGGIEGAELMDDPEKGITEAKQARTDLDSAIESKLKGLLREEQRAKLPEKRPDRPGRGPFGDEEGVEAIAVTIEATERREAPVEGTEKKDPD